MLLSVGKPILEFGVSVFLGIGPMLVLLGRRRVDDPGDVARPRQHEFDRSAVKIDRLEDGFGGRDVVLLAG